MTHPARDPGKSPPPDELLDALFDGELSPRARREVLGAVRHDARARRDLERTTHLLTALRTPPDAPDLTGEILARADSRRRFVPARLRRLTTVGRVGVIALGLVVMLGIAAGRRAWPDQTSLAREQTPLGDMNAALRHDAAQGADAVRASVRQVSASFGSFTGVEPCRARLRVEVETRTITTGLTAPFGPAADEPAAPPSVRCGSTRLGAGSTLGLTWTDSGEAPACADSGPRILP